MTTIRKYNPTSPARRQMEVITWRGILTPKGPEKSLTSGFRRSHGRNAYGRITTRHKGGGEKRLWREVDFKYDKIDIAARVVSLEYDPNRTSFIALLVYRDGEKRYVLAPQNLKVGSEVTTSVDAPVEIGNRTILRKIPIGTAVYNIELEKGRGAQLVRSAGTGAMVLAKDDSAMLDFLPVGEKKIKRGMTHLKLPSGEIRMVSSENWASIGSLSNPEHKFLTLGKAGRSRHLGIRPTVRGTAMNPVDHPHGGGEGRTLLGRRRGPATPWGKPARGVKTRKRNKRSDKFIVSKRKK